MPVKRTSKYQLSQWKKSDKVLMEDFNTDNLNVENALAGLEASKAKQTDLTALKTEVGTKASQSALDALKTEVAAKAAQSELNSVSTTLNAAKASIPKFKAGFYTGDGQPSKTISVGFTPTAVLVVNQYGQMYILSGGAYHAHYGGLAVTGSPALSSYQYSNQRPVTVEITTNGFIVHYTTISGTAHANSYTNTADMVYHYIAFG